MIDLYYWGTPNGHKVSIALEELGLPYRVHPTNIGRGDQFKPEFLSVSPNNRIPAIVDHAPSGGASASPISVFESGAILIYLAEKTGKLLSPATNPRARAEELEWLMWQMAGVGPMFGQANHFWAYAPEDVPYGKQRYLTESKRLLQVLDRKLEGREYIANDYGIADIATFPWVRSLFNAGKVPITLKEYPNVETWLSRIASRPAVVKGLAVETPKTEMDEEARRHLFGPGQHR